MVTALEQERADWRAFVTLYNDLFMMDHCGYWLRGVVFDPRRGWLAWEDDEVNPHGKEPHRDEAVAAWTEGRELPPGWFALNEELADKAWEAGVRRWGEGWYDDADADSYDYVVQMALLGEVRYG